MSVKQVASILILFMMLACITPAQTENKTVEEEQLVEKMQEQPVQQEEHAGQPKEGVLLISITGKALSLGNITSVKVKVLSASAYHKEKTFWTTVNDADVVIDLLELKKKSIEQVYGNKSLPEGNYSMLKLKIGDVKVTRNDKEEDAFLPSGELKIQMPIHIDADQQTKVTLDFVVDESLHKTGDGKIIFAPVLHVKSGKQKLFISMNEKKSELEKQPLLPKPTTIDEKMAALDESVIEIGEGEKKTVVVQ